ncbi:hypothetical protein PIB30_093491 [Stylosanthes scabra]|uniref:Uncharacterized protein n=1 Tax=Stylosanthes scabra TaxID=79078 RepID=A0ABU6SWH8_9FABA|nr:hypothetical protein [Stylosanthes scabra]
MIAPKTDAKVTGPSPTLQDLQRECGKYPKGWIGSHPRFVYFDPHVDGEQDHLVRDRKPREVRGLRRKRRFGLGGRQDTELSHFWLLDVETPLKRKIPLLKNWVRLEDQVRNRSTFPLVSLLDLDHHHRLLRWFPLHKVNEIKKGQSSSRVGNSFRHPKGIAEEDKNEEEEEEEEEDPVEVAPEEEMPAIPRPMDVDAEEDYLQYLEDLRHHPSTVPSIVVRHFLNILSTMHNLRLLKPTVSPAMIFPGFGRLQLV